MKLTDGASEIPLAGPHRVGYKSPVRALPARCSLVRGEALGASPNTANP